jgi:hypothetical protein
MGGLSGILGKRFTIGHLQIREGESAVATMALKRREIRELIVTVVPGFRPPTIDQHADLHSKGRQHKLFDGQQVKRTLADLLWTSETGRAVTAMRKIFQANKAKTSIDLDGIKDLGSVFGPFSVAACSISQPAKIDYAGNDFRPLLVEDTKQTRAVLQMGGMTRLEDSAQLKSLSMQAGYVVNKEGVIITDWDNAKRIRQLLSWATGLSLDFLPHYRGLSSIETSIPAYSAMEGIVSACGLQNRELAFFWLGRYGNDWYSHIYSRGGSAILKELKKPQSGAVLLTIAK